MTIQETIACSSSARAGEAKKKKQKTHYSAAANYDEMLWDWMQKREYKYGSDHNGLINVYLLKHFL